jgi:hypothetical protein
MKGKLEPKEWRPMIASSLIYRKILVRNVPGSILVTALVTFVILIVGAGVMSAIFGNRVGFRSSSMSSSWEVRSLRIG